MLIHIVQGPSLDVRFDVYRRQILTYKGSPRDEMGNCGQILDEWLKKKLYIFSTVADSPTKNMSY